MWMVAMRTRVSLYLLSVAILSACTTAGGSKIGFFTIEAPVFAKLGDDAFVGKAVGYTDRTGTIEMTSAITNEKCVGSFAYTGARVGEAKLTCTSGATVRAQFNSLGPASGYGVGVSSKGPMSFTFGLTAQEAEAYLTVPNQKPSTKNLQSES